MHRRLEDSTTKTGDRTVLATALAAAFGTTHTADPARTSVQAGCAVCHSAEKWLIGRHGRRWPHPARVLPGAPALLAERARKGGAGM